MNPIVFYAVLCFSMLTSSCFIIWHNNQKPLFSLMLKLFASFVFVALGAVSYFYSQNFTLPGLFIILGLVASLVGDGVLALLEFKLEGQKEKIIICGMISFSVAQILYFVAFLLFSNAYLFWVSIIGAVVIALAIIFGEKLLKLNYGKTKLFTGIYSFVLALSLIQSLMFAISAGFSDTSLLMFLGMISFFVSDLILSFIYFSGKTLYKLYYPNYAFYFMAQNLIACALAYLVIV